jgi:hypothetical protein
MRRLIRESDRATTGTGLSPESLDEQLRRKGVPPIRSVHDLARPDLFESDEELDEFLKFTYTARRADLA